MSCSFFLSLEHSSLFNFSSAQSVANVAVNSNYDDSSSVLVNLSHYLVCLLQLVLVIEQVVLSVVQELDPELDRDAFIRGSPGCLLSRHQLRLEVVARLLLLLLVEKQLPLGLDWV